MVMLICGARGEQAETETQVKNPRGLWELYASLFRSHSALLTVEYKWRLLAEYMRRERVRRRWYRR